MSRAALDDSSDGEPDQESDDLDHQDTDGDEDSQEYDDPDNADLERDNIIDDEEIDSDDAFGDGEEDFFKKKGFTFKDSKSKTVTNGRSRRAVAADFMSGSESDEDEDESESSSDQQGSDNEQGWPGEEDSEEGSEEEDSGDEDMGGMDEAHVHSVFRKAMDGGRKTALAPISQAAREEAEKGVAVRQQRRTYDSLLNLRIRLQKGLVAINSLGEATDDENTDKEPYEAAEEAALKLWTTIDGFRAALLPEQKAGQKRKRPASTSTEALWAAMQATEGHAAAGRRATLEKWSARVGFSTATNGKERQLANRTAGAAAGAQSFASVLEGQLVAADRLVKRTRVPRSCAPIQAGLKVAEDAGIYDDADFYQLLLKELVDQRSADAGGAGGDGANGGDVPTVRWTAISEAKTRKQVDRRASKGRKLRFTVHEKLQNFMAPEDRRGWEDEAIDRLFGTLFGQRIGLREDIGSDGEDEQVDIAEEGLKLFRS